MSARNHDPYRSHRRYLWVLMGCFAVFWVALAVTIFFGLIAGTVLTMVMVPTLYAVLYRIPSPSAKQ